MRREAYRTVYSLTRGQTDVEAADYEIVVVDNGSPDPVDAALFDTCDAEVRVVRMPDPTPSPAAALDHGVTLARRRHHREHDRRRPAWHRPAVSPGP